jgi:hypothetical protein
MITIEFKNRFLRSLRVLAFSSVASFMAMIIVQYFMGGIRNLDLAIGKSLMIGFALALFVFLLPTSHHGKYPWQ